MEIIVFCLWIFCICISQTFYFASVDQLADILFRIGAWTSQEQRTTSSRQCPFWACPLSLTSLYWLPMLCHLNSPPAYSALGTLSATLASCCQEAILVSVVSSHQATRVSVGPAPAGPQPLFFGPLDPTGKTLHACPCPSLRHPCFGADPSRSFLGPWTQPTNRHRSRAPVSACSVHETLSSQQLPA